MESNENNFTHTEPGYHFRHLLGIEGLNRSDIEKLLNLSDKYVEANRLADKKHSILRGRTLINLFFENSTRTSTSFELAGKRLGGDVINMSVGTSSIKKGETLIDQQIKLRPHRKCATKPPAQTATR